MHATAGPMGDQIVYACGETGGQSGNRKDGEHGWQADQSKININHLQNPDNTPGEC